MKNTEQNIKKIISVKELHSYMGLPSPLNPLITIIDHSQTQNKSQESDQKLLLDFYNISIKRSFKGKLKYGKNNYDFDDGTMSFIAPNQILSVDNDQDRNMDGWSLLFHPDLIRQYPLGKAIKSYGFFSYTVNEALHLSDEEEKTIEIIIQNIQKEINSRLDLFSQDVIVSNLELLLSYCNRFYSRQFLTRKMATNDLLTKFEIKLDHYFSDNSNLVLPKVEKLATELNVSSPYLSDMLRNITGQNTQQHIHEKLIEKAKEILTTTNLTVSEIAYQLGFEYPQSFSKLFKSKTNLTPSEYRHSYN
ncbi:AraC family transcriptional regulator [Chryseobacterium carnipullorum]|uniref:AraC family transcriptional regulator n=4 Tax=Chryseobacterium carnipullorum TaxID=1124835 RepID=A0A3G6M1J6_CHRCU|nr:AraC family transcriptional regulator [Chryseobacterium carnipullorum]AZA49480.1 AraC family transcriptional regulator [Chryseobacterium carnipullorum]AZA64374.1 AraC family transcriptional regulator [Chryseobacterium carnipullorum]